MEKKTNIVLAVIYSMYIVGIIIITMLYHRTISKYTNSMVEFHSFLTNYR